MKIPKIYWLFTINIITPASSNSQSQTVWYYYLLLSISAALDVTSKWSWPSCKLFTATHDRSISVYTTKCNSSNKLSTVNNLAQIKVRCEQLRDI